MLRALGAAEKIKGAAFDFSRGKKCLKFISLDQWFFLNLWTFNTVPYTVVNPNYKNICFVFFLSCNFASVLNHNINSCVFQWGSHKRPPKRSSEPQIKNCCSVLSWVNLCHWLAISSNYSILFANTLTYEKNCFKESQWAGLVLCCHDNFTRLFWMSSTLFQNSAPTIS